MHILQNHRRMTWEYVGHRLEDLDLTRRVSSRTGEECESGVQTVGRISCEERLM